MIIRFRSSKGTERCVCETSDRLVSLTGRIHTLWPETIGKDISLRKEGTNVELLHGVSNVKSLQELNIGHGDLIYVDWKWNEPTNRSASKGAHDTSPVELDPIKIPTRWGSHAVMYTWVRWAWEKLGV